jgi:hypothetical protein
VQRGLRLVQPSQQQAHMHEVELSVGQLVLHHVVYADLQVRPRQLAQHRGVHVGRHHLAFGADALGQPGRDRAAAGGNLEAPPAPLDAGEVELPPGSRIELRLECPEPLALQRAGVVEGVCRVVRSGHAILLGGSARPYRARRRQATHEITEAIAHGWRRRVRGPSARRRRAAAVRLEHRASVARRSGAHEGSGHVRFRDRPRDGACVGRRRSPSE